MKTPQQKIWLAAALAACTAFAPAARAQFLAGTISVDFNSTDGGNGTDASAGQNALLTPGTWNEFTVANTATASGGPLPLGLSTGNPSNVALSYTAGGSYDVIPYMSTIEVANSPNLGLLRDFIFNKSTTVFQSVTLTGLSANTAYNLYLYSGGNNNGRQTVFNIGGVSQTATFADADTTFVAGHNYVPYLGVNSSASGSIVISFAAGAGGEGDFNGLQITPAAVPEPSAWAAVFGGVGLLGLALRLRPRQA